MPELAAHQGHPAFQGSSQSSAGSKTPQNRISSKSTVVGIGVAGALLTAAVIAGVVMMSGSNSAPANTQMAAISTPAAVAPAPVVAPVVAPATVYAPVAQAAVAAPTSNVAPAFSPPAPLIADSPQTLARFAAPAPAPALNVPGQCQIGQRQMLALNLSATKRREFGNVIRIHSGSYVSPPIVLKGIAQTVTFPAPPGARDSAEIIIEQKIDTGSTFDDDANGITTQFERTIDNYHDILLLRWATPRC